MNDACIENRALKTEIIHMIKIKGTLFQLCGDQELYKVRFHSRPLAFYRNCFNELIPIFSQLRQLLIFIAVSLAYILSSDAFYLKMYRKIGNKRFDSVFYVNMLNMIRHR